MKRQVLQSSDSETDLDEEPKYDNSSDSPWDEVPDVIDNWFCFICGEEKVMDMAKMSMKCALDCPKMIRNSSFVLIAPIKKRKTDKDYKFFSC